MKHWKRIAADFDLGIPGDDLDKIVPTMDALEASFRPIAANIPHETEPAIIFHLPAEERE